MATPAPRWWRRAGASHRPACRVVHPDARRSVQDPAHRDLERCGADQTSLQTKSGHASPIEKSLAPGVPGPGTTRDGSGSWVCDEMQRVLWTTCRLRPTHFLIVTSEPQPPLYSVSDPQDIGGGTGQHCSKTQGIGVGFISAFCEFFCSGPGPPPDGSRQPASPGGAAGASSRVIQAVWRFWACGRAFGRGRTPPRSSTSPAWGVVKGQTLPKTGGYPQNAGRIRNSGAWGVRTSVGSERVGGRYRPHANGTARPVERPPVTSGRPRKAGPDNKIRFRGTQGR